MTIDEFMGFAPYEITLFITGWCNYNCAFCGYKDTRNFRTITIDTANTLNNILDRLFIEQPNRKLYINFIGGEPTVDLDLLSSVVSILNNLRKKHPDNIKFWLTSNGYFGNQLGSIEAIEKMSFDKIVLSCSPDHLSQNNYISIGNIIAYEPELPLNINFINKDKIKSLYYDKLKEMFNDEKLLTRFDSLPSFDSSPCYNIVDENKLLEYYNKYNTPQKTIYAPFGLFIVNSTIYTACAGNGHFPWCKLSENLNDIPKLLDKIYDMHLTVMQPCSKECMITCRHLQKMGYTCFDKKYLEIKGGSKVTVREVSKDYFEK